MGNKCNEPHSESNLMISSNSLVSFIKQFVQEYSIQHKEIEQLSKYVNSFKKDQFAQMLQNDHYITLLKKSSIKMEIQQLARISMNDSFFIINELRIQNLQFQDLYNDTKLQNVMVYDTTKLRNKQFDYSKEIVAESVLYNIFLRMCDEKSVLYQLIHYWVVQIKNPDYVPIIDLVSQIAVRMYESLRDTKIPSKIYELLMIWMVQVIVFNLAHTPIKKGKEEHLLDLIFYHRCPIEKLMILHAQDQLIRKQFVIRDTDDLANRTDQILRDYRNAHKLQAQIQLINTYVKEDWFVTLSHTLQVWDIITKRF